VRTLSYADALREALREELTRDPAVFLMGEDIGIYGGAFGITRGLIDQFGPQRILDTPISEGSFVGAAIGAAIAGSRPVVEIMFMDFVTLAVDQMVNQAAKLRYVLGPQARCPLVLRAVGGAGRCYGPTHSQSFEAWFTHVPGLKVVAPATPADAKGLLKASIRDDNPVVFMEHKLLYGVQGTVPDASPPMVRTVPPDGSSGAGVPSPRSAIRAARLSAKVSIRSGANEGLIPLGKARLAREGTDITLVAWSWMAAEAERAAQDLSAQGISAEVVDLRTLAPLDIETITASVKKTHRVLIVQEAPRTGGFGAEIGCRIFESVYDYLDAPLRRLTTPDVPFAASPALERTAMPDRHGITEVARKLVGG
jgi:pyruvate/2-oxoglutarate/acetoin dehydrogenase E1 component